MKTKFLRLLLTLIAVSSFLSVKAQTYTVLNDVTDILSYNNSATNAIFVKDTLRGGNFFLYTGSDIADNGMIFKDFLNRKWLRQTNGNKINILWYGARAANTYNDYTNSIRPYFKKAQDYIYNHNRFTTLFIPKDQRYSKQYTCDSTLYIYKSIKIEGDGEYIWFQQGRTGFTTAFLDSNGNACHVLFEKLTILGGALVSTTDTTAHGIMPKGYTEISNCTFLYWEGNGIHYETCSAVSSPIYGNVDFSKAYNNEFAFCNNGIYLNGCDANIVTMDRNFYTNMRRWGLYNNGFLGSQSSNSHYSINGYNTNCWANYGGKTYYAINTNYAINIGKRPDLEPTYWEEYFYYDTTHFSPWNTTKKYWSGGPYFGSNDNSFSKFDYEYTEGNQAPARVEKKNLVVGGDNGADVKGGAFIEATGGLVAVKNSGMWLRDGNFSIGSPSANSKLRIFQKTAGEPAIWLSSDSLNGTEIRMGNNTSPALGQIYYINNGFQIGTSNTIRVLLDTALKPNINNTFDLGSSDKYFKNIYGINYFGNASTMTGIPVSYWNDRGAGNISNNNSNNLGINQTTPVAQLHIVGSNTSKLGLLITGGSAEGWNTSSGQIQLGHTTDHLSIGYEGANGFTYFDNSYNNVNAKQFFRLRTTGTPITPLTLTGANAVGVNNTSPNASAVLDVSSTTKGFLPPRMTTNQKNAVTTPTEGLMVYDLTLHKLCVYTGTKWEVITSQ